MLDHTEWPFTDFLPDVAPMSIRLTGSAASKAVRGDWSVQIHEMVTGRFGYVLGQIDEHGEANEMYASGAFDEPWNAMQSAIGEMNRRDAERSASR